MNNPVRGKLQAGQPTLGAFLALGSLAVVEVLAEAGLEWLVSEVDHNAFD